MTIKCFTDFCKSKFTNPGEVTHLKIDVDFRSGKEELDGLLVSGHDGLGEGRGAEVGRLRFLSSSCR